jgi:hypothetical protein
MRLFGLLSTLGLLVKSGAAIDLVIGDEGRECPYPRHQQHEKLMPRSDSVKSAASTIAFGLAKVR